MILDLGRTGNRFRTSRDQDTAIFLSHGTRLGSGTFETRRYYNGTIEKQRNRLVVSQPRLEEAQSVVNVATALRSTTTINSIPPELLTEIFSFLINSQACIICQVSSACHVQDRKGFAMYPDSLSHVCSAWRRLIIGVPYFWSHIDIALDCHFKPEFLARAKMFAARAGMVPLEIHLCDHIFRAGRVQRGFLAFQSCLKPRSPIESGHNSSVANDFDFFLSLPAHIKSLDIDLSSGILPFHVCILKHLFAGCEPGKLKSYSIRSGGYSDPMRFIEPIDDAQIPGSMLFSVPSQRLEQILYGTTSLRLDGICLPWSSKAYHGLVELRLGGRMGSRIPESSLVQILRSSPELRILHLRVGLDDPLPLDNPIILISLKELEEVDILGDDPPGHSDKILRWIAPSSRPIQLNFVGIPSTIAVPFCARSRITRFYGEDFVSRREIVAGMICRSSRLEILALNARRFEDGNKLVSTLCSNPSDTDDLNPAFPSTTVDTLYFLNFTGLSFHDIQNVVNKFHIRRLMLRNTSIAYQMGRDQVICADPREIKIKLSGLESGLVVEYLTKPCSLDLERWW
ncbi:unnamed protein product [Rhizoctonia solani]|uniref:F-box domain-containing protein n=1 Tax=Rhizoctonia solani TaxID=456999 RepID=A0A8H2WUP0_9AGAM|nr:unnamed protein product [Rhizoctonia solani]